MVFKGKKYYCPLHRKKFKTYRRFVIHQKNCKYFKAKRGTKKLIKGVKKLEKKQRRMWD